VFVGRHPVLLLREAAEGFRHGCRGTG
jgi:hypothetical protein